MKIFNILLLLSCFSVAFAATGVTCECVDGKQIPCDESLNKNTSVGQANRCFNDCDCSEGRECKKTKGSGSILGWCGDKKE
jgi:hypothetical protein